MKYFNYCFVCLLLLSCQSSSEKQDKRLHYQLRIIQRHLSQCLYPQALKEVKKTLSLEPDSYIINNVAGVVYFSMKEYKTARGYFAKAVKQEKAYTEARVNLAQTLIKQNKLNKALIHLQESEKDLTYIHPSKVHSRIGEIYYKKRNYSLAEKHLKTAFQVNQENCAAPYYLGKIYYDKKQYKKALSQFQTVKECQSRVKKNCHPPEIDYYYFKAQSEIKTGDKKSARKTLNLLLKKSQGRDGKYVDLSRNLLKSLK